MILRLIWKQFMMNMALQKSSRESEERNLRRKSKRFAEQVKLGQTVAVNFTLSLKVK